jgi:hypothetical protein
MKVALQAERIDLPDSLEEINRYLYANGMTDGLPIVPPTEDRVSRMLEGTSLEPYFEVASLPPEWAPATVEAIAINAVMAGCLPEHMPVLITLVKAMAQPEFSLLGVLATTGGYAVSVMLNGPIRHELDINCTNNLFGPGKLANATIGRALRLFQLNIGGVIPGVTDKSCQGWPGKYTICWGENEEASPWTAYHVEKGFSPMDNAVTIFAADSFCKIRAGGTVGRGALQSLAYGTRPVGAVLNGWGNGAKPFIALGPETASQIARDNISKAEVREYFFEHARSSFDELYQPESGEKISFEEMQKRCTNLWPDETVSIADQPDDISVVVAGGPGRQSVWFPANARSMPVTMLIDPLLKRT